MRDDFMFDGQVLRGIHGILIDYEVVSSDDTDD